MGARNVLVSENESIEPKLIRLYQNYLNDERSARFIQSVATYYTVGTLERLLQSYSRTVRRASILALGFLGDFGSNEAVGRCLNDNDRGVRILSDNGIRQLWCRDGRTEHRQQLLSVIRLNGAAQYYHAIDATSELIDDAPCLPNRGISERSLTTICTTFKIRSVTARVRWS